MKKTIRFLTILIGAIALFHAHAAFAWGEGGAGDGTGPSGGSCAAGYWNTCHGYTWQAYKVLRDLPSDDSVHFHYSTNVPMVALHYCKEGQTLYNYGFDTTSPLPNGYQVGTEYNKSGVQAVTFGGGYSIGGARGAYPGRNNTTGGYLEPNGDYINPGLVAIRYTQMALIDESDPDTNYTHGTTWATVGYFCYDDGDPTTGEFYSKSSVMAKSDGKTILSERKSKKDNTSANENTNVKKLTTSQKNVKVTFRHFLYTEQDDVFLKAKTNYKIVQTSNRSDLNNKVISEGTSYVEHWDADGEYYTRRFSSTKEFEVGNNESVWICQQITYQPKFYKMLTSKEGVVSYGGADKTKHGKDGITTNGVEVSHASKQCIKVTHKDEPETDTDTPDGPDCDDRYVWCSPNRGNTTAESKVINYNRDGDWQATTYAKPGDEIQFKHGYNFGAQAVRTFTWPDTERKIEVPQNWFYVTAEKNGAVNDKYLFDHTDLRNRITLSSGEEFPSQLNSRRDDPGNNEYSAVFVLPRNKGANYKYGCTRFGATRQKHAFQVPGFESNNGNCNAQNAVASNSDVGSEISQTMHYRNLEAWVGWKTTGPSGSCSCDNNSANGNSEPIWSFPMTGSYKPGRWTYNCRQYTTCRCHPTPCACDESGCHDTCYDTCPCYEVNEKRKDYPLSINSSTATTSANVKIPYNFDTAAASEINTGGSVIYAGENVTSSVAVQVKERLNSLVSSDAYMTITPSNTVVQAVAFTLNQNTGASSAVNGGISLPGEDPCSYYRRLFGTSSGITCTPLGGIAGAMNKDGQLEGEVTVFSQNYSDIVPDVEVGSKYCVAVGISHADSHGFPDAVLDASQGANGLSMGTANPANPTNPSWRISNAACRTIAKKPNFEVWGGIYTQGNIATTVSKKNVNATISSDGTRKIFGSWSDTLTIANEKVTGFASGAGLGYIGGGGGADSSKNYCNVISMTISNSTCNSIYQAAGDAKIEASGISNLLAQILSRYSPATKNPQSGANVIYQPTQTLSGGAQYTYVNGNANLGAVLSQGSGTRIIEVTGTLTIDHNICSGSGTCQSEAAPLVLTNRNNQAYNNIANIPQVLLIAGNINITSNVNQIDAWLIASNGNVNTCTDGHGSANSCNRTLIFNGPVFARTLSLNRTAGAYPGDNRVGPARATDDLASTNRSVNLDGTAGYPGYGSLTPAEIFNLRSDVYYWAQNQANRLTQATVVYMRELAPRY